MDIADKIKYIRTDIARTSQDEFAKRINVTRNTVKNWESGISKPTINHILLISILWGISTDFLLINNAPEALSLFGLSDEKYDLLFSLIKIYREEIKINESAQS